MAGYQERILDDDYPIYADYFYVVDDRVYRSDFHDITVKELRQRLGAREVTSCDIFGRGGFEACAAASKRVSA